MTIRSLIMRVEKRNTAFTATNPKNFDLLSEGKINNPLQNGLPFLEMNIGLDIVLKAHISREKP